MNARAITQEDIAEMSEAELAVFAAKAPQGFTPAFCSDRTFAFIADWVIEEMSPSRRAELTIIRRAHWRLATSEPRRSLKRPRRFAKAPRAAFARVYSGEIDRLFLAPRLSRAYRNTSR